MMSGMPLQTRWAFNKFWNNKFYYKVASCWLFLLIHTTMHGFMNIKFKNGNLTTTAPRQVTILFPATAPEYNGKVISASSGVTVSSSRKYTTNYEYIQPSYFFRIWESLNWKINAPKHFDLRIYYYNYRLRFCSWARRIRFTSPNDFVPKQKLSIFETPRSISQHVLCGEGLRCFSLTL